jgi:hypothetical protein
MPHVDNPFACAKIALPIIAIVVLSLGLLYSFSSPSNWNSPGASTSQTIMSGINLTPFTTAVPIDPASASFSSHWYRNGSLWAALDPTYQGKWYAGMGIKSTLVQVGQ